MDAGCVLLWGTSFSGGHVVVLSASLAADEDLGPRLAGVVALEPALTTRHVHRQLAHAGGPLRCGRRRRRQHARARIRSAARPRARASTPPPPARTTRKSARARPDQPPPLQT